MCGGGASVSLQITQDAFILYEIKGSGTLGELGEAHVGWRVGGREPDSLSSPPVFLCLHTHAPLHYLP